MVLHINLTENLFSIKTVFPAGIKFRHAVFKQGIKFSYLLFQISIRVLLKSYRYLKKSIRSYFTPLGNSKYSAGKLFSNGKIIFM